jgi:ectoine hydroxylase-related dioxygenase (phytanoyl-CoA dioxygenase family)
MTGLPRANLYDARDAFIGLSAAARIRHFETEGYVVLPNVVAAPALERIKAELADKVPMRASFFTDKPAFSKVAPLTRSAACAELIAHAPVLDFLRRLMGEALVFMHNFYILSHPGAPALEFHTDFQPFGSTYSSWLESCPLRVRVLYYLDDTRDDRSALRIVPRSHICFHADAQPYRRYKGVSGETVLPLRAGDAFVFAVRLFHATTANTTDETRGMLEYDYRPLWARPYGPIPDWTEEELALVPPEARALVGGRNRFDVSWEFDVKREAVDGPAPGMSPGRWDEDAAPKVGEG